MDLSLPPLATGVGPIHVEAVSVPEPATWAMMLLGFAGLGFAAPTARKSGPHVRRPSSLNLTVRQERGWPLFVWRSGASTWIAASHTAGRRASFGTPKPADRRENFDALWPIVMAAHGGAQAWFSVRERSGNPAQPGV